MDCTIQPCIFLLEKRGRIGAGLFLPTLFYSVNMSQAREWLVFTFFLCIGTAVSSALGVLAACLLFPVSSDPFHPFSLFLFFWGVPTQLLVVLCLPPFKLGASSDESSPWPLPSRRDYGACSSMETDL
jgi:hypothetical protein